MDRISSIDDLKTMHTLPRSERIKLSQTMLGEKPDFLQELTPRWWWGGCTIDILLVADGSLDYGYGTFGLYEFVRSFRLPSTSLWRHRFRITLAHRDDFSLPSDRMLSSYPHIADRIVNFKFDEIDLQQFDQIWLFAIDTNTNGGLTIDELDAVHKFMDGGGGLFATGDHGALGSSMCIQIDRVKDMRLWNNTHVNNDLNEVSMGGRRRNDTNRPAANDSHSKWFDNQSDNIPQTIGPKRFGSQFLPHPILSISRWLRASGVIDIMPDHPHEGEVAPSQTLVANRTGIRSQVIATSFVLSASSTYDDQGKDPTDAHCFPSIGVWDGHRARVGRIVVDSTWHHFVNVNLNGTGSIVDLPGIQPGLSNADLRVIQQYYINIAHWLNRSGNSWCWKFVLPELLFNSQVIEASMNRPDLPLEEIDLEELRHIGALVKEVLSGDLGEAMAESFAFELVRMNYPKLADAVDPWHGDVDREKQAETEFIRLSPAIEIALGAGFIRLRDELDRYESSRNESEILKIMAEGIKHGMERGMKALSSQTERVFGLI